MDTAIPRARFGNLRTQVVLLVLIAVVPAIVLAAVMSVRQRQRELMIVREQVVRLARGAAAGHGSGVETASDFEWLERLTASSILPSDARLTLVDARGLVRYRHPSDPKVAIGQPFEARRAGDVHPRVENVDRPDGRALRAIAPIGPDGQGGFVVVERPVAVILADANRQLAFELVALGLIAAVCAFVARRMAASIQHQQDQLREAETSVRVLVDQSIVGVYVLDADRIVYCNEAFARAFGRSVDEVLRCRPVDLVHPDDQTVVVTSIATRIAGEFDALHYTFRGQHPDGTTGWCEVYGRRIEYRGRPALLGALLDVTEHRRSEEAREESELHLQQVQRLEAIGRLAGGIAHDFNNLLLVINGHAEALRDALGDTSHSRNDVETILRAADRAASLTRQLLAFSRKQQLCLRPIDLNATVTSTSAMLRRVIGEDITLHTVLASDLPAVTADVTQLEQVLMNLAVNARDAMPGGGVLTIETASVYLDDSYAATHVGVKAGHYARLAVSDTGTGMDTATVARVFEPFFTTKEKGRGTGLGLSTVYGIVKQSGGNIWVYSEPGCGTTFKVYLPLTGDEADLVAAPALVPVTGGAETILLVEDEDAVRDLLADMLKQLGYDVLTAAHGDAALAVARRYPSRIDLMLSDVIMPGLMHGPDVYARLAPERPDMKVIFMSGYTDHAALHSNLIEAGSTFLGKPFTRADLAARVRSVLDSEALVTA
jgi:PAS domain S-box-containing protein